MNNLKEQLIQLINNNKNIIGAISISKTPNSKYYQLYKFIIDNTQFLPIDKSISERIYYIINDLKSIKLCKCGCGQPVNNYKCDYLPGHGNKSEEVKNKKIQKYIEKYGVSNPSQSKEIKEKKKQTLINHYGSIDNAKKEINNKYRNTCIQKYNVDNIFKLQEVKDKIKDKWNKNRDKIIEKRKKTHYDKWLNIILNNNRLANKFEFLSDEFKGVDRRNKYKFKCLQCGNIFEDHLDDGRIPRCLVCDPYINTKGQSNQEYELQQFLQSLNINFKVHDRNILKDYELDFYIPDKNIAIEYNGLYYHSELGGKKDRNYHLNKLLLCEKSNIRLIQIFEDEWIYKRKIVENRLRYILGCIKYNIYARDCEVREIDNKLKNKFLDKYHIQSKDNNSKINLGLFYKKNRLVAVMTFGKRRFDKKDGYELIRFCTIGSFNIIGGASKLFSYFLNNYNSNKLPIISYADRRWSNGNLYNKLGFKLIGYSKPNYFYLDKNYNIRLNRIQFQKHKLKNKLKIFNEKLSEWNNMKLNKYDRIWDCGNLIFIYNYN